MGSSCYPRVGTLDDLADMRGMWKGKLALGN